MGFMPYRRSGNLWDDVIKLDKLIKNHNFNINAKSEREFETSFASVLMSRQKEFNSKIMTQIDKETTVQSVYCFGKKHRPDMTLENNGIAIEIKYISENSDNFKDSIGQTILYRLRYRFIFQILIVSKSFELMYDNIINEKEADLKDLLAYLSQDLNIFTYIVPSFTLKNSTKKYFSANDIK